MSDRREPGTEDRDGTSGYDALGFGMTFAASTLLFFAAGVWVDDRLGSSPLFALIGLLMGGGAGFWWMYVRLMGVDRSSRSRSDTDGSS